MIELREMKEADAAAAAASAAAAAAATAAAATQGQAHGQAVADEDEKQEPEEAEAAPAPSPRQDPMMLRRAYSAVIGATLSALRAAAASSADASELGQAVLTAVTDGAGQVLQDAQPDAAYDVAANVRVELVAFDAHGSADAAWRYDSSSASGAAAGVTSEAALGLVPTVKALRVTLRNIPVYTYGFPAVCGFLK